MDYKENGEKGEEEAKNESRDTKWKVIEQRL
jgi:hypothetical protein